MGRVENPTCFMKYISILFFIFILVVIVLADNGRLPHFITAIYDFPYGDKFGHFILYGFLNFFIIYTFLSSSLSKSRIWVTLLVGLTLALLIALEEFSQKNFPTRTFDLIDLSASYLGLLVGGSAAWKLKK
jgi:polysaccharide biosynthesis protein VpsQ